ncbi:hypothetical protein AK37_16705 [Rhodococcus pyridinivorans AK37]|uniref:Uncharacterized protein n=1 Tax=Rhodococcus pyridinivorans AK37 TaxID=1114960 RepID=H0JUG7_9NOCA|nr:hypothetical protein AK37_16705 [Rhodococcus pyridinivorans AK37]
MSTSPKLPGHRFLSSYCDRDIGAAGQREPATRVLCGLVHGDIAGNCSDATQIGMAFDEVYQRQCIIDSRITIDVEDGVPTD